ncbi:MAG TPA: TadE/TadG family type IV pilus assembly protein [Xanthobacteraceae bacterium]|nr:TadE/TadG family type IV pilus assembly protein [Xanthobacteraceae bacterium]
MTIDLARLTAPARRLFDRLLRDRRGISSIEFSLLLPAMALLFFGGVELTNGIAINRKVSLLARTLGDLVSQETNITSTEMSSIFGATAAIVQPYSTTPLQITVSSIQINSQGTATVSWSQTLNGTALAAGSSVTLPAALDIPSTSLILAQAQYAYKPAVGYVVTGTVNLTDQIYLRPRMSSCVLFQGVQSSC